MDRRDFLKQTITIIAGAAVPATALEFVNPKTLFAAKGSDVKWVFLADTQKCVGCGFCVKACKLENEVPYDANVSRTWVERYVICKDGKMRVEGKMANAGFGINADSPKAGRDGFTTPKIDIGEGKQIEIKEEDISKAFFVPKLCNQCDNPPCVQVCPVGATYKTGDGVVLVDRTWCIGCGYCVMGCPYGVRFFHPIYKVAEKCNFCYHRITKGMKTACVQSCPFGARQIGNLKDPNDPVTKTVMTGRVGILKSEYGTKPQVYYLALDREVR